MTLQQFLATSYTQFHTIANCKEILIENDFIEVDLFDIDLTLQRGGRYFATTNGSSLIAFAIGEEDSFNLALSHTDSPCLHIKGNTIVSSGNYNRANVEEYGGMLRYTFLDRPLRIAGRVFVEGDEGIESNLVASYYNVVIPSVAIHHNRQANSGLSLTVGGDMLPLLGDIGDDLYTSLTEKEVLDADLYVVSDQSPFYAGVNNSMLSSPRLDNLTSVYSSIMAMVNCNPSGIAVACCFDNEEIGNGTKQGAQSQWLGNCLRSITSNLGLSEVQHAGVLNSSFAVSIDNGHAIHPAHPEKYDSKNCVNLGGGVVIKHNSRYATDALSSSVVVKLCSDNDVATQHYYNNSDLPSGGTLGGTVACNLSMAVCDIGIAQLAMHSACETINVSDVDAMTKAVEALFNSYINVNGEKIIIGK